MGVGVKVKVVEETPRVRVVVVRYDTDPNIFSLPILYTHSASFVFASSSQLRFATLEFGKTCSTSTPPDEATSLSVLVFVERVLPAVFVRYAGPIPVKVTRPDSEPAK